jgi:hypothetical protein
MSVYGARKALKARKIIDQPLSCAGSRAQCARKASGALLCPRGDGLTAQLLAQVLRVKLIGGINHLTPFRAFRAFRADGEEKLP